MEIAAAAAAALMGVAGLVHAFWAVGGVWPGSDEQSLAKAVVGPKQESMPGMAACFAVTALLSAAAGIVVARAELLDLPGPGWIVTTGSWVVAGALAARGLVGLVTSLRAGTGQTYHRLDLRIYSPLCLVIAALCLPAALS